MKVMVVAAHPDDEVLGCGGTLARHAAAGDEVDVVYLTDGVGARGGDRDAAEARQRAAGRACMVLGLHAPEFLGFPDNRLDTVSFLDLVSCVEEFARRVSPDTVYTHHGGDLNVDHRIAHRAVMTCFRPGCLTARAASIYSFEILSSTEWSSLATGPVFRPVRFVDIEATLEKKLHAMAEYSMEIRAFPHPRSPQAIESLARVRGAGAGFRAAEGFVVERDVFWSRES